MKVPITKFAIATRRIAKRTSWAYKKTQEAHLHEDQRLVILILVWCKTTGGTRWRTRTMTRATDTQWSKVTTAKQQCKYKTVMGAGVQEQLSNKRRIIVEKPILFSFKYNIKCNENNMLVHTFNSSSGNSSKQPHSSGRKKLQSRYDRITNQFCYSQDKMKLWILNHITKCYR